MTQSIREQGILTPLLVRRRNGSETEYEVISGHRRLVSTRKAGLSSVPVHITDMDRNAIAMVDSNLPQERLLPSEKAFACKMKEDGGHETAVLTKEFSHYKSFNFDST